MVVRIIIAGESHCEKFAQICLVADHLSQTLPSFCYERIEKSVLEWKAWLAKINQRFKWHHLNSPLVWKELLMKGSKPYYIGGTSDFLDYCYSYYQFDYFLADSKFDGLTQSNAQYLNKVRRDNRDVEARRTSTCVKKRSESIPKTEYVVCISGASNPLTMHIISELLETSIGSKSISKIFIFDNECTSSFMEYVEKECSYVGTNHPGKVVKYIEKVGVALTHSDMFIILDHVPFDPDMPIGEWLHANKKIMENLALMINASAKRETYILLPNLGPACFNATVLMNSVNNVNTNNIVVATSDLGLDVAPIIAEIAEVSMRNMFCPPVWGFVGINHIVDVRTTVHKYNTFEPYSRYTRVKTSTLNIGNVIPEMRTMEYLLYFDETLWRKALEMKRQYLKDQLPINKAKSLVNVVKLWLFGPQSDEILCLGIKCNGAFGLNFNGAFSQPAHFINGQWKPAENYFLPRDSEVKLPYLEEMANLCMKLQRTELPKIVPYYPCSCKPKFVNKKCVWGFKPLKIRFDPRRNY